MEHRVFGRGKVLKATPIAGTALSRFSLTASASKDDGKLCAAEKVEE
ncbi:hypothetical protein NIA69_17060 [Gemmiger formicilis]|nr:hypothetical protein [Gemmiger formicilis]